MARAVYSYRLLRRHLDRSKSSHVGCFRRNERRIRQAFVQFDRWVAGVEARWRSPQRNVQLLVACKFLNHVLAALLLAEHGLIVDSIGCLRSSVEALLYGWLLQVDEQQAELYIENQMLRPVEVRKRLAAPAVDIELPKTIYRDYSGILHVGRESERWILEMTSESEGTIRFGGGRSDNDVDYLIGMLVALVRAYGTQGPNQS